jgi:DNA mismatch repair protein MutL
MVDKIKRLPRVLVDQIAAGEVIERPASVVKELIENACDAGATRIEVATVDGGVTAITVADDGEGMSQADLTLALERHATSKIAQIGDLEHLQSFGFRGEALPSIASVAKVTLESRTREHSEGHLIEVEGGRRIDLRPVGGAVGTRVTVRDLFYNVPARRKFLKSTATENGQVHEVVMLAALARPDVTFRLLRDGRQVAEYLKVDTHEARARAVVKEGSLRWVQFARGPFACAALLGPPERARSGMTGLHLFVNGRPVRDRMLARSVAQAYGSVLESGKYPLGVVYIDVPGGQVDINVHPQKSEVRFSDGRGVFDVVRRGLGPLLAREFALPSAAPLSANPSAYWQGVRGELGGASTRDLTLPLHDVARDAVASGGNVVDGVASSALDDEPSLFRAVRFYAGLRFLAQARGMFLLCEADDALYVLDQHAAHERVTFHDLKLAYAAHGVATQRLLVPVVLSGEEAVLDALEMTLPTYERAGFELRRTGRDALSVLGTPAVLSARATGSVLRELLLDEAGEKIEARMDLLLATVACHASVRAGDMVSRTEAEALLARLDAIDFGSYCPHGRPVVTRFGFDELARRVGR